MNLECPRCEQTKPEEEFAKSSVRPTGRQYWCRSCKREYDHELYQNDPHRRATIKKSNTKREHILARRIYEYFASHPCKDCGEADPLVLELDNPPGRKKPVLVSRELRSGLTNWNSVLRKLTKYDVRCANCRRTRIRRAFGWYGWKPPVTRQAIKKGK